MQNKIIIYGNRGMTLENDINTIDKDATNDEILSTLSSVEKKTLHLTKLLGIKVKKRKK